MSRNRKVLTQRKLREMAKLAFLERMQVDLEEEVFEAQNRVVNEFEERWGTTREDFFSKMHCEKNPTH